VFEEVDGALEGLDLSGFVRVGGGLCDEGLGEADAGFDGGDFDGALEAREFSVEWCRFRWTSGPVTE
jgi:hypothetical protein